MFQAATLSQSKFKALRKGNTVWNLKFLCRRRFTCSKVLWHTLMGEERNVVFGQGLKVSRVTSSLFPLYMSHETYRGGRECALSPFVFEPLSKSYIMLFSH